MKTTRPATMSAAQNTYAMALAAFETVKAASDALKVERGVDYTTAETEEAIDAMAEIEGECERAVGLMAAERVLRAAEQTLIAWGIDRACKMSPGDWLTLRDLQVRAERNVAARAKVVALCFRLAA